MSTFEETRRLFVQEHFTVVEVDLPVVNGACTISGQPGYGTPLSCDQPSNDVKTYKFTTVDAPPLPESGIYRCIKSISETPTELKSGRGLASRGSLSVTMVDFKGDPNPFSPAVIANGQGEGFFLAKMMVRNELSNKNIRIKNYRVEEDGSIDLANGAEIRHYLIESADPSKGNIWKIKGKDELSRVNDGETVWPLPLEGALRADINSTQTTLFVDANTVYKVNDTLRIGDEFVKVSSVSNIGTGSASVVVGARGSAISYTNILTLTENDEHSNGDEIFVCEVSDNERIDALLKRILLDVGVDSSFIPISDWVKEIDEWLPNTRVNTIWFESEGTADVLERILTEYMIDMWFDPVSRKIKLSAISAWKESTATLKEGNQIDFDSITRTSEESLRATRALIVYDRKYLATSDSIENYSRSSLSKREELESGDLYGEPKTKRFENSPSLDKDSADKLVSNWVNRYSKPESYTWKTQERKLDFNVGDVVDKLTRTTIGFDGTPSEVVRSQIISIKPNYTSIGRDYTVKSLSYRPLFATGSEVIVSGNINNINLANQYIGSSPSQAVELTFIIDGAIGGSTSVNTPAITTGYFPAGSKLIIILVNGADLQGKGGGGGGGQWVEYDAESGKLLFTKASNGGNGGVVFDANGVDCDIYLSGPTPNTNYPLADGYIRAPSGGDGGFSYTATRLLYISGNGGDGGNGRSGGNAGSPGYAAGDGVVAGKSGKSGVSNTGWGLDGVNNHASKGLAGKGVVDNGATVNLFGATAARYINGRGDH